MVDRGDGLGLDRWRSVEVRATTTDDLTPTPDADPLRQSLGEERPVTVEVKCSGNDFVVTSVRAAR